MAPACEIDVENMTMSEIKKIISGIKLEPGRSIGDKSGKAPLSNEAVWGITSADDKPIVVITTPVAKKFAVNMLYQGAATKKPKIDFVLDSKLYDTSKMLEVFNLLQARLVELATESIPKESTNSLWKGKPNKVKEEMKTLLKEGKEFTSKDGTTGRYDPNFTLSIKVPNETDMKELEKEIAAYEPPHPDAVSKGYKDDPDKYIGALRQLPPFTWGVKIKNSSGESVPNDVLLERRTIVAQLIFELNSLMIKPTTTLSIQTSLRQMRVCDVALNKRRLDDADLDAMWKAPKTVLAGSPPRPDEPSGDNANGNAGAAVAADDDY
jgi:hypothetical protein